MFSEPTLRDIRQHVTHDWALPRSRILLPVKLCSATGIVTRPYGHFFLQACNSNHAGPRGVLYARHLLDMARTPEQGRTPLVRAHIRCRTQFDCGQLCLPALALRVTRRPAARPRAIGVGYDGFLRCEAEARCSGLSLADGLAQVAAGERRRGSLARQPAHSHARKTLNGEAGSRQLDHCSAAFRIVLAPCALRQLAIVSL